MKLISTDFAVVETVFLANDHTSCGSAVIMKISVFVVG